MSAHVSDTALSGSPRIMTHPINLHKVDTNMPVDICALDESGMDLLFHPTLWIKLHKS